MAVHGPRIAARSRLDAILPAPRDAAAGLLGVAAILATAFVDGGYFPTAWGVPALVGLWIAAIAISVAPAPLHRREAVALAASRNGSELERLTIYVATLAALLLVARKESVPWLLGGAAAAIVVACGVALVERLFQGGTGPG
jgi:hypothetical protein